MNPWFIITVLGDGWVWAITLIVFVLAYFLVRNKITPKRRKLYKKFLFTVIPSVVLVVLVVLTLKSTISLERPCMPCLEGIVDCNPYCGTDSSFPSGHSSIAFAGFGSIFLVFRKKWVGIMPVFVAISRVALGVHTGLDVVFGSLLGISVVYLVFSKLSQRLPD